MLKQLPHAQASYQVSNETICNDIYAQPMATLQHMPKGTNILGYSQAALDAVADRINTRRGVNPAGSPQSACKSTMIGCYPFNS